MMNRILDTKKTEYLLRIFEHEREQMGWVTASELLKRIAKCRSRAAARAREGTLDVEDERLTALMGIPELALAQNVMSSTARRGHATDDLKSLRAALVSLGLKTTSLHDALVAKLDEEERERADAEPGDPNEDFQGGSIGF